jgi:hypothetical protein
MPASRAKRTPDDTTRRRCGASSGAQVFQNRGSAGTRRIEQQLLIRPRPRRVTLVDRQVGDVELRILHIVALMASARLTSPVSPSTPAMPHMPGDWQREVAEPQNRSRTRSPGAGQQAQRLLDHAQFMPPLTWMKSSGWNSISMSSAEDAKAKRAFSGQSRDTSTPPGCIDSAVRLAEFDQFAGIIG